MADAVRPIQSFDHHCQWVETSVNARTGAMERQCNVCGAIQSWSPTQTAWSWDVMPWEEFGLNALERRKNAMAEADP